ncbi:MAG: plasmid mobilization protein [Planctomycetota bacterium]
MRKAKKLVADYRIILERNDRLGFIGSAVELPTVFADAKTPEGQRPPQPASAGRRTEQVNVRLTAEEKLLFANAATNLGFKGISDFIRNTALNNVLSSR